jgi:hypothetical protein
MCTFRSRSYLTHLSCDFNRVWGIRSGPEAEIVVTSLLSSRRTGHRIRGPRTDPCWTPNITAVGFDFVDPQRTYCQRPPRYDANQFCTVPPIPYNTSRRRRSVTRSTDRMQRTARAMSATQDHQYPLHAGYQPVLAEVPSPSSGELGKLSEAWLVRRTCPLNLSDRLTEGLSAGQSAGLSAGLVHRTCQLNLSAGLCAGLLSAGPDSSVQLVRRTVRRTAVREAVRGTSSGTCPPDLSVELVRWTVSRTVRRTFGRAVPRTCPLNLSANCPPDLSAGLSAGLVRRTCPLNLSTGLSTVLSAGLVR